MPVSYIEFAPAARNFPIVFASNDQGKSYAAVAVLGLAQTENLFVRNGAWEQGVYVPAYVRRYPFCMARVTLDTAAQAEPPDLRREVVPLRQRREDVRRRGQAHAALDARSSSCCASTRPTSSARRELCAILADYDLFEPFTMQATPATGAAPINLAGMFRVQESKLEHLNAAQHKNLFKKGIVGRIYAHLLSLENFGHLLARRAKVVPAAEQPAEPAAKSAPAAKAAKRA